VSAACLVDLDVEGLLARGGWEPRVALDDFLIEKAYHVVYGPKGSGKTWLWLYWMVCLATGRPFLSQKVHGEHRVLALELEQPVQILQRLPLVCAALGVELADVLDRVRFQVLDGRALRLETPDHVKEVMDAAAAHRANWIFVDAFRRTTALNENDSGEMARLTDCAFLPLRDSGVYPVVLDHSTRHVRGQRGSGDKGASADMVIEVQKVRDVSVLRVEKGRLIPERERPLSFRVRRDGVLESAEKPSESDGMGRWTAVDNAAVLITKHKPTRHKDAVQLCLDAGFSKGTAKRAWLLYLGTGSQGATAPGATEPTGNGKGSVGSHPLRGEP
jgi:hypothetical protein